MSSSEPLLDLEEVEVKKDGQHTTGVLSISFSPCSYLAVTTSDDNTAVVWMGKEEKNWTKVKAVPHPHNVNSCMFHPTWSEGKLFATGCGDGAVRMCRVKMARESIEEKNVDEVECSDVLVQDKGHVFSLSFSPSGTRLAVVYPDQTVFIFNVKKGKVIGREEKWPVLEQVAKLKKAHSGNIDQYNRVAFSHLPSPSGSILMATAGVHNRMSIRIWRGSGAISEGREEWKNEIELTTKRTVNMVAFASSFPAYSLRAIEKDSTERADDWIAAACSDTGISIWRCRTSVSPPSFSESQELTGEHRDSIKSLAFAVTSRGGSTLLVAGDSKGTLCVWKNTDADATVASDSSSSLSSLARPNFLRMQTLALDGAKLIECCFSPSGRTLGIADISGNKSTKGSGPYFWPCHGVADGSAAIATSAKDPSPYPLPQGLISECLSDSEMEKVLATCLDVPSYPYYFPPELSKMRPLVSALLADLSQMDKEANKEEEIEEEREEECSERKGVKEEREEDNEREAENDVSASIQHMLTAALGFHSADLSILQRVETSLTALQPALPLLLEMCKKNQAGVSDAVGSEVKEDEERRGDSESARDANQNENKVKDESSEQVGRSAVMRTKVFKHLIETKETGLSSRLIQYLRGEVEETLEKLKADMRDLEERDKDGIDGVKEVQTDGAAYDLAQQALNVEKATRAIPHLLEMSETLDVDLLDLSETPLAQAIGTDCVRGMEEVRSEMLRIVTAYRDLIKGIGEEGPSASISSSNAARRSTSSLSAFLAGRVPEGIQENAVIVSAASALSASPPCLASEWRCAFGRAWSDLRHTLSTWQKLEGKIEEELKKESTTDDFKPLSVLLEELRQSGMHNEDAEKALTERISSVRDHASGRKCWKCGSCPPTIRFYPCEHACLCMECVGRVLHSEQASALKQDGCLGVDPDSSIRCCECNEKAEFISRS